MPFKNFRMWRGRLPHWRADDVTYLVNFRHRRPLDEAECNTVLTAILRGEGTRIKLICACSLPDETTVILMCLSEKPAAMDFGDFIEKAKLKAGKRIILKTGERYSPLGTESYDRIIRDAAEFEEHWMKLISAPVDAEVVEDSSDWGGFWATTEETEPPFPR